MNTVRIHLDLETAATFLPPPPPPPLPTTTSSLLLHHFNQSSAGGSIPSQSSKSVDQLEWDGRFAKTSKLTAPSSSSSAPPPKPYWAMSLKTKAASDKSRSGGGYMGAPITATHSTISTSKLHSHEPLNYLDQ
ncbi:unnamed protein product [Rotaria sp. Silwood1]|nr:unnamed protein product [Rotaria sp. Silwood1]